jgi:hypothetical protein
MAYLSTRLQQLLYDALERTKELKKMVVGMQASVEVVTATTLKTPVFSGNHANDWTIWEMKMTAQLMEMFGS